LEKYRKNDVKKCKNSMLSSLFSHKKRMHPSFSEMSAYVPSKMRRGQSIIWARFLTVGQSSILILPDVKKLIVNIREAYSLPHHHYFGGTCP